MSWLIHPRVRIPTTDPVAIKKYLAATILIGITVASKVTKIVTDILGWFGQEPEPKRSGTLVLGQPWRWTNTAGAVLFAAPPTGAENSDTHESTHPLRHCHRTQLTPRLLTNRGSTADVSRGECSTAVYGVCPFDDVPVLSPHPEVPIKGQRDERCVGFLRR